MKTIEAIAESDMEAGRQKMYANKNWKGTPTKESDDNYNSCPSAGCPGSAVRLGMVIKRSLRKPILITG